MGKVTEDRLSKWVELRSHGQWSFVWRYGVLRWGLIMCGVFVGMQSVQHPDRIAFILAINVPLWLLGGVVFGLLGWLTFEWKYKRHLAKSVPGTGSRGS